MNAKTRNVGKRLDSDVCVRQRRSEMQLTDDEKAMLDGKEGAGRQRAMELLVRYCKALGAERLVDTNNVAIAINATNPHQREWAARGDFDGVFAEFNLDSPDRVEMPPVKAFTCHLIGAMDLGHWQVQGVPERLVDLQRQSEAFFGPRGIQLMQTCTPYQVGNVPVKGEHCAWMESSAVIYCNSVLGACTNTEGTASTGAAALTGKIPYWGYHMPENRFGTHLIRVECEVESMMDWGILGYFVGEAVEEDIPVIDRVGNVPNLIRLKHFGAAAASSGGVEMYHVAGVTPEAPSIDAAFGPRRRPAQVIKYGPAERRATYDNLNSQATDRDVDFVMLGCPHESIEQVWEAATLLDGKKLSPNTQLWVHTPRAIRQVADRNGYTRTIEAAGAHLMSDTCPAISQYVPKGTKVVATDSAKQGHYLPAILGVQCWFGSMEDCVNAAVSGRWNGAL
jgi:predicted aconitase